MYVEDPHNSYIFTAYTLLCNMVPQAKKTGANIQQYKGKN